MIRFGTVTISFILENKPPGPAQAIEEISTMNDSVSKKRIIGLDVAKATTAFLVILIHTCGSIVAFST